MKIGLMSISPLIDYTTASDEVRSVFKDIMETRGIGRVNNFWMALANGYRAPVDSAPPSAAH